MLAVVLDEDPVPILLVDPVLVPMLLVSLLDSDAAVALDPVPVPMLLVD